MGRLLTCHDTKWCCQSEGLETEQLSRMPRGTQKNWSDEKVRFDRPMYPDTTSICRFWAGLHREDLSIGPFGSKFVDT
jgi:hypothetical protein